MGALLDRKNGSPFTGVTFVNRPFAVVFEPLLKQSKSVQVPDIHGIFLVPNKATSTLGHLESGTDPVKLWCQNWFCFLVGATLPKLAGGIKHQTIWTSWTRPCGFTSISWKSLDQMWTPTSLHTWHLLTLFNMMGLGCWKHFAARLWAFSPGSERPRASRNTLFPIARLKRKHGQDSWDGLLGALCYRKSLEQLPNTVLLQQLNKLSPKGPTGTRTNQLCMSKKTVALWNDEFKERTRPMVLCSHAHLPHTEADRWIPDPLKAVLSPTNRPSGGHLSCPFASYCSFFSSHFFSFHSFLAMSFHFPPFNFNSLVCLHFLALFSLPFVSFHLYNFYSRFSPFISCIAFPI